MQVVTSLRKLKLRQAYYLYFCMQRRWRYKKKWAMNSKPTNNCQLALDYFDAFHKSYYGHLWPSIRLALTSLPKHCAAVNKYNSDSEDVIKHLKQLGTFDFVELAKQESTNSSSSSNYESVEDEEYDSTTSDSDYDGETDVSLLKSATSSDKLHSDINNECLEPCLEEHLKDNLEVFMPTQQVYSEREELLREEMSVHSFQQHDIEVETLLPFQVKVPDLSAFIFPKGKVARLPQARAKGKRLEYFLMDAASTLPVMALDIQPSDRVLDLCAAPGGKSFLMLQTLDLEGGGALHCNDLSRSRLARLRNVLELSCPAHVIDQIVLTQMDGRAPHSPVYDKVLVDVPCFSDRHVVTEEDNNLFKASRTWERLQLMQLQKELLVSGIKACRVGGFVVYSTCTLSPAQNDGVIQAVVEDLQESSEIEVSVQDLKPLSRQFEGVFLFHGQARLGQLVLPSVMNNFGPIYFSRIRRTK